MVFMWEPWTEDHLDAATVNITHQISNQRNGLSFAQVWHAVNGVQSSSRPEQKYKQKKSLKPCLQGSDGEGAHEEPNMIRLFWNDLN